MHLIDHYAQPITEAVWRAAERGSGWGVTQFDVLSLPSMPVSVQREDGSRWNKALAQRIMELLCERGATCRLFPAPAQVKLERVVTTIQSPRGVQGRFHKEKTASPREQTLSGAERFGIHFSLPDQDVFPARRTQFVERQVRRLLPIIQRVWRLCYQTKPVAQNSLSTCALKLPVLAKMSLKVTPVLAEAYAGDAALTAAFGPEQFRVVPHTEILYQRVMNRLDEELAKSRAQWPGVYWRIQTEGERVKVVDPGSRTLECRGWQQLPCWQEYLYVDHIQGKPPWTVES